jgi:quinone-modifying oxidoreductase subunit QmoC
LTAKYDWTGLSGLLYRSLIASISALIAIAAGVIIFSAFNDFNLEVIMHYGHLFEMFAIGGVFLLVLAPNVARMWYFTVIRPGKKVPLINYIKGIGELFIHMFTQKRALGCDDNQRRWFEHFILVLGYLSLLFITVF